MGFTTPCFIRKDTECFRENLKELGYIPFDDDKRDGLVADKSGYIYSILENNLINSTYNCGNNKELFLAIAALRDDSNYMQWFICTEDYIESPDKEWKVGDWDLNTCPDVTYEQQLSHWRKATVEELINHFK